MEHQEAKEQMLRDFPPEAREVVERPFAITSVPVKFDEVIERARVRCAELAPGSHPIDQAIAVRVSSENFSSDYYASLIAYYAARLDLQLNGEERDFTNQVIGALCVEWELSVRNKEMASKGRVMTPDKGPMSEWRQAQNARGDDADYRDEAIYEAFAELRAKDPEARGKALIGGIQDMLRNATPPFEYISRSTIYEKLKEKGLLTR